LRKSALLALLTKPTVAGTVMRVELRETLPLANSQRVRLHELRRIHQLIHELMDCGHDPAVWRLTALQGLKTLLHAQVGLTVDMKIMPAGEPVMIDPVDTGWQTDSVRRRFMQYLQSGEMARDPGMIAWLSTQQKQHYVCRMRRQLLDDRTWYAAPSVSEARKMGDVDDFVVSTVALEPGAMHGFVLYRSWSEKPFEARDQRLLKLFHLELGRAAIAATKDAAASQQGTPLPDTTGLSLRLRQTLDLLLSPLSLKQIAAHLGLSRHTVNDYQKVLYRRFNVSTRMELFHRFRVMQRPRRGLRFPDGLLSSPPPFSQGPASADR
jgi:DNA-binding CsgD family transcriptional regulator